MSEVARILVKAGIVSDDALKEFRRWRLPVPEEAEIGNPLLADNSFTAEKVVELIERAIQEEGYVLTRETDLDALNKFLSTMRPAVLHLFTEEQDDILVRTMVGHHVSGEYILPWQADSISDWLINKATYLEIDGKHVYFASAREIFYGGTKSFVLCAPMGEISP